jgi:hypothetical protein
MVSIQKNLIFILINNCEINIISIYTYTPGRLTIDLNELLSDDQEIDTCIICQVYDT